MSDNDGSGAATLDDRRAELARFLRTMRERADPRALGIKLAPRRRAKGMLREEVAHAAGISGTWYTWMEQARPTNPSHRTLSGIADALQLSGFERQHMFKLARPDLSPPEPDATASALTPSQAAFLAGLTPHPAYAFDELWNVIAWNDAASDLLGAFDPADGIKGNILSRLFLDDDWRSLFVDWEEVSASAVAQFRAATVGLSAADEYAALIALLTKRSPRFAELWLRQTIAAPPTWRKTLDHPRLGRHTYLFSTLRPDDAENRIRLAIYVKKDSREQN